MDYLLVGSRLAYEEALTMELRWFYESKYKPPKLQQKVKIRHLEITREEWRDVPCFYDEMEGA